jgi:hypothetical protein
MAEVNAILMTGDAKKYMVIFGLETFNIVTDVFEQGNYFTLTYSHGRKRFEYINPQIGRYYFYLPENLDITKEIINEGEVAINITNNNQIFRNEIEHGIKFNRISFCDPRFWQRVQILIALNTMLIPRIVDLNSFMIECVYERPILKNIQEYQARFISETKNN